METNKVEVEGIMERQGEVIPTREDAGKHSTQRITCETKVHIALDAMLGYKDKAKIAQDYGMSVSSVNLWLKQFKSALPGIFDQEEERSSARPAKARQVASVTESEVCIERKQHVISRQLENLNRILDSKT